MGRALQMCFLTIQGRPSFKWKSVSSRASSVLPAHGRGDATTVTELRNNIKSQDDARASLR
jgi:hypothetical protein